MTTPYTFDDVAGTQEHPSDAVLDRINAELLLRFTGGRRGSAAFTPDELREICGDDATARLTLRAYRNAGWDVFDYGDKVQFRPS